MRLGTPRSPGLTLLLCLLTCGIYNIYWDYKMGKRIAEICVRAGLPPTDNALLYLVLDLIGAGGGECVGAVLRGGGTWIGNPGLLKCDCLPSQT